MFSKTSFMHIYGCPTLGQNHEAPPGGVLRPTTFFSLEVTSKTDGSQYTHKIAKLFLIEAGEAGEC